MVLLALAGVPGDGPAALLGGRAGLPARRRWFAAWGRGPLGPGSDRRRQLQRRQRCSSGGVLLQWTTRVPPLPSALHATLTTMSRALRVVSIYRPFSFCRIFPQALC